MFPIAHVLWNSVVTGGVKPLLLFHAPGINQCRSGTVRELNALHHIVFSHSSFFKMKEFSSS